MSDKTEDHKGLKKLLNSDQLIDHMRSRGIMFNIMDESHAKEYIENNTYYRKIAAYKSNYQRIKDGANAGNYINLEFAYLKELSIIDMHLRYQIIEMCLSIEHYLKVKLLNAIENTPEEDGYNIIKLFTQQYPKVLNHVFKRQNSAYCKDLINKYAPDYPVWVFVELTTFGDLGFLCNYYKTLYGAEICSRSLTNSVRDLRNAAAHSNCLINHLQAQNNKPDPNIVKLISSISSYKSDTVKKRAKNKFIYDFCCLLIEYNNIVSSEMVKKKGFEKLADIFNIRMKEHAEWFDKNNTITSAYMFSKNFLDRIGSEELS